MAIEPKWLVEVAPQFFKVADVNKISKRKRQEKIEPLFNKVCQIHGLTEHGLTCAYSTRNRTSGGCQRSNGVRGRVRRSVEDFQISVYGCAIVFYVFQFLSIALKS